MAKTVIEVANPELFSVAPGDRAADVLSFLLALGVSTCPVQDAGGTPLGVVGIRALYDAAANSTVGEIMSAPALVVGESLPLHAAAEVMCESGYHHLVVVDGGGRATAMLSSLDLIRGLAGLPIAHPPTFPHRDERLDLSWSDERRLDAESVEDAPTEPGVLSLIAGEPGTRDQVVWSEHADDVRERLRALVREPPPRVEPLRRWLETRRLRFRTAPLADPARARHVVDVLQRTAGLARGA